MSMGVIRRFPRLAEDDPLIPEVYPLLYKKLTGSQKLRKRIEKGDMPRGWDKLTKKHKKLIRLVLRGTSVIEACDQVGFHRKSFYKWLNLWPKFRKYYFFMSEKLVIERNEVDQRLDAALPRAARLVEDALQSEDTYFATEQAVTLLKGRGRLKTSIQQKNDSKLDITTTGKLVQEHTLSPELATLFVNALVNKASGLPLDAKPIDIELLAPVQDDTKELADGS
jgi:transposase-like protein